MLFCEECVCVSRKLECKNMVATGNMFNDSDGSIQRLPVHSLQLAFRLNCGLKTKHDSLIALTALVTFDISTSGYDAQPNSIG
jgi:hypothetical protein